MVNTPVPRLATVPETSDFDPATVPAYPLVRVELRECGEEGEVEGVVDDVVVHTGRGSEPAREAVIAAAAEVASKRIGAVKAVRVRGVGLDGVAFRLVVTAAGEVFDLDKSGPDTKNRNSRRDRNNSKNGELRGSGGTSPAKGSRVGRAPSLLFVVVVVLPVVLFVGGPVTALVWRHAHSGGPAKVQPLPPPVQLPVVPPAPYSDAAAWSQPLGTAGYGTADGAQVVADADGIYVTRDTGSKLAAYGPKGRLRWTYTDLGGQVTEGPALATVGGRRVLEVATQTQLTLLNPDGQLVGQWKIPSSAQGIRLTSTGPLVLADAVHAEVVAGGRLVSRVIPATGTPVAPTAGGAVLVVAGRGAQAVVWTVASGQLAGSSALLAAPKGMTFAGVAGAADGQLVLAFQATDHAGASKVVLAAYRSADRSATGSVSSWRQEWVSAQVGSEYTGGPGDGSAADFPLAVAPTGSWGIYGAFVLDLLTGKVTGKLPADWKTSVVGDAQAFGAGSGRPLVVTPQGPTAASLAAPQPPAQTTLVPPQAASGKAAYVVATPTGSNATLYALKLPTTAGGRK